MSLFIWLRLHFLKGFSHSLVALLWVIHRIAMHSTMPRPAMLQLSNSVKNLVAQNSGFGGLVTRNLTRSRFMMSQNVLVKMTVSSYGVRGGKCKSRMYQVFFSCNEKLIAEGSGKIFDWNTAQVWNFCVKCRADARKGDRTFKLKCDCV